MTTSTFRRSNADAIVDLVSSRVQSRSENPMWPPTKFVSQRNVRVLGCWKSSTEGYKGDNLFVLLLKPGDEVESRTVVNTWVKPDLIQEKNICMKSTGWRRLDCICAFGRLRQNSPIVQQVHFVGSVRRGHHVLTVKNT